MEEGGVTEAPQQPETSSLASGEKQQPLQKEEGGSGRGRRFQMVEQQISKAIGEQIQKGTDKCARCGKSVFFNERNNVKHCVVFHRGCLKCERCGKVLDASDFFVIGDSYFCRPHYNQLTMRAKVRHRNPLPR